MFSKSLLLAAFLCGPTAVLSATIPSDASSPHHLTRRVVKGEQGTLLPVEFGYSGAIGPENWGDLSPAFATCKTGTKQSLINFEDRAMLKREGPTFNWGCLNVRSLKVENNGLGVEVEIPEQAQRTNNITIAGTTYSLRQFHFHTPSEHRIGEKWFPMEVHFVHTTPDSKIAVVGAMFEIGRERSAFLDQLMPSLPCSKDQTVTLPRLDLRTVLPKITIPPFWRYEGSLTTPPCTEGVQWTVVDKPLTMSLDQYEKFRKAVGFNARPTQ
ncbi:hypothetical protein HK102_004880 [Quaeritorhiza haematococci]|nr:hypothetical protein HK102_004880 [Quaeritorhiza haematococci]